MVSSGTKRSAAFCTARCSAASSAAALEAVALELDTPETPSPATVIPSCPSRYGFLLLSSQTCLSRRNRALKGGGLDTATSQKVKVRPVIPPARDGFSS